MRPLALLMILSANVLAGLSYPWQKMALQGLPPATVIVIRHVIGIACLALFVRLLVADRTPYDRSERARLAFLGIVAMALPLLLGIVGIEWSTAGNGSILVLLEPATILLLSWLILKESLHWSQLVGIAAGFSGALCIVLEHSPVTGLLEGRHLAGNVILALHGMLWGLFTPLIKPLTDRHRPLVLTLSANCWALLLMVPASLLEIPHWRGGPELGPALFWCVVLGVAVSFGATALWIGAIKLMPASKIAGFVFLQPLTGVIGGGLLLGEAITAQAIAGGVLIAAGLVMILRPARQILQVAS